MTAQTASFSGDLAFDASYMSPEEARGTMGVQPGLFSPIGTLHAGAMIWFADVVATALALQGRTPTDGMQGFPPAITLSANLLANGPEGHLHAKARFVKKGRRSSTVRTEVTSDEGRVQLDLPTTPDIIAEG